VREDRLQDLDHQLRVVDVLMPRVIRGYLAAPNAIVTVIQVPAEMVDGTQESIELVGIGRSFQVDEELAERDGLRGWRGRLGRRRTISPADS